MTTQILINQTSYRNIRAGKLRYTILMRAYSKWFSVMPAYPPETREAMLEGISNEKHFDILLHESLYILRSNNDFMLNRIGFERN